MLWTLSNVLIIFIIRYLSDFEGLSVLTDGPDCCLMSILTEFQRLCKTVQTDMTDPPVFVPSTIVPPCSYLPKFGYTFSAAVCCFTRSIPKKTTIHCTCACTPTCACICFVYGTTICCWEVIYNIICNKSRMFVRISKKVPICGHFPAPCRILSRYIEMSGQALRWSNCFEKNQWTMTPNRVFWTQTCR